MFTLENFQLCDYVRMKAIRRKKEIIGYVNEVSEDLRDYLRREGIKIYTDKPFKSIKPVWLGGN